MEFRRVLFRSDPFSCSSSPLENRALLSKRMDPLQRTRNKVPSGKTGPPERQYPSNSGFTPSPHVNDRPQNSMAQVELTQLLWAGENLRGAGKTMVEMEDVVARAETDRYSVLYLRSGRKLFIEERLEEID